MSGHGSDSDDHDLSLTSKAERALPFGRVQFLPEDVMRVTGDGRPSKEILIQSTQDPLLATAAMEEESKNQTALKGKSGKNSKPILRSSTPMGGQNFAMGGTLKVTHMSRAQAKVQATSPVAPTSTTMAPRLWM